MSVHTCRLSVSSCWKRLFQAEADLLQAKEEGEVLKKQASEKTEQETEALKALAQGKEEEAVSAVIKALL